MDYLLVLGVMMVVKITMLDAIHCILNHPQRGPGRGSIIAGNLF